MRTRPRPRTSTLTRSARRTLRLLGTAGLSGLLLLPASPAGGRPESHPLFQEGFRAFQFGNWPEAAEKMRAAQESWAEDGLSTRAYDRWFEPYAPLFYLGRTLGKMGCYPEALEILARSPLCRGALHRREIERDRCQKEVAELRQEAATRPTTAPPPDCARWGVGGRR